MTTARYGYRPDTRDQRDFQVALSSAATLAALPSSVDLRQIDPLLFEQNAGDCVANAAAALHHFCQITQGRTPFVPSRRMIYYDARLRDGTLSLGDFGTMPRSALAVLHDQGVCSDDEWNYGHDINDPPSPQAYADALPNVAVRYENFPDRLYGIPSFDPLAELKASLARRQPFIFGFPVTPGFDAGAGGDGNVPEIAPSDPWIAGHCGMAVGYDDHRRNGDFLVKNCWGPNHGEQGYFWFPYQYMSVAGYDKWTLTVEGPLSSRDALHVAEADLERNLEKLTTTIGYLEAK